MRRHRPGATIGRMKKPGVKQQRRSRRRSAGFQLAETISIVAQMALLCPSGIDVWAQRELAGYSDASRRPASDTK
jgi:hypothetical protein